MQSLTQAEVIKALHFQIDMGVDEALSETPIRHYQASDAPHIVTNATPIPAERTQRAENIARPDITPPLSAETAIPEVKATTLGALEAELQAYAGCNLKKTAKNTVFSDGIATSKIMLVGEAPGRDEDRMGKPFVGRSGQLLDNMLHHIGLTRHENIYISNIIPWRPPGNRNPSADEIAQCLPFITRHIEIVAPEILLLVGGVSAKTLLQSTQGITKLRGKWQNVEIAGRAIPALPLLHPAYLLRAPDQKAKMWSDLCLLAKKLHEDKP